MNGVSERSPDPAPGRAAPGTEIAVTERRKALRGRACGVRKHRSRRGTTQVASFGAPLPLDEEKIEKGFGIAGRTPAVERGGHRAWKGKDNETRNPNIVVPAKAGTHNPWRT